MSNTKYPLQEGEPDALVIHCSDPRFQEAFRAFVKSELGINMPMVIALPGTTSAIGVQAALPKNWHTLKNFIETMTSRHKVSRVVLINHDDCKGYARVAKLLGGLVRIPEMQKKHLKMLAKYIQEEHLPGASFELYQAHIDPPSTLGVRGVYFEKVN